MLQKVQAIQPTTEYALPSAIPPIVTLGRITTPETAIAREEEHIARLLLRNGLDP
ncbi:hypothetical protein HYU19_02805 [Candidatus Woesearchaeota archaeon]|nr:hypothetical protein [Candidatus Woesearchaeota archaeon]